VGDVVAVRTEDDSSSFLQTEKTNSNIHKTFVDPSGTRLLISMNNGDNYYINTGNMKKPKKLKQMTVRIMIHYVSYCMVPK
jgi:hypothetical protein